ncbi:hypothetical protein [Halorussus sp. MSC15.2]|uniref:hypothetical protein n=1 Tax=Halorussus sp. MSC15.2 TaxID=2283638 RepID=UPI0013D72C9D|nr:hypothetical protein [Halorussus sp. MSC15.2]NEU57882.1 hypothetical protein [Halorussus sp. MSC15.2]
MHSRRQVLAAGCLALVGGSGCSRVRNAVSTDSDDGTTETDGTTASGETPSSDEPTADDGTATTDASAFRIVVADGDREIELVTGADVASVDEVEPARTGDGYRLPVTLTDEGTADFADGLERAGAFENRDDHPLRTYFEGEMLYEATLAPGLADKLESGEWSGEFLLHVSEQKTARELKQALEGN